MGNGEWGIVNGADAGVGGLGGAIVYGLLTRFGGWFDMMGSW